MSTASAIENCTAPPLRADLDAVLGLYCVLIVERLGGIGFPIESGVPQTALTECWGKSDNDVPPKGCLVPSRAADEQIMCRMLKRLTLET